MAATYEVQRVGGPAVLAWSTRRLPFEPTGWLIDLRNELRAALADLRPVDQRPLYAVYASGDRSRCDLENVLVYNVGARPFASAARDGFVLERRFVVGALALGRSAAPPDAHWLWYGHEPPDPVGTWRDIGTLAHWQQEGWPRLSSSTRAATVWHRLMTGPVEVGTADVRSDHLGIELVVTRPQGTTVSPANVVKSLVDGVLAALCRHDGTALDVATARLAGQLDATPDEIRQLLMANDRAVLGTSTLVRPYRTGVQWHPPDDQLVSIDLRVHDHDAVDWQVAGRLFAVESR